jgi:glycosyltransferase involved in cell wall biosynthesis
MVTNYPILSNLNIEKNDDGKTICFAGGISSQWMHDNIIKAIKDIKKVKYLLIGNNKNDYFESLKGIEV